MNNYTDSYDSFYKTFLQEMPQRVSGNNDFAAQLEMLQENIRYDHDKIISISSSVFKIHIAEQTTYWMGNKEATSVSIIVDTEVVGKFRKVVLTSKNPAIPAGSPPYASDLYLLICNDAALHHLIFTSDELISGEAEKLWQGLIKRGGTVSVYDNSIHQYILQPVKSGEELSSYIGGPEKRRYVFVLSETLVFQKGMTHTFSLMEIKRLAKWPLFDHLIPKKGLSDE